MRRIKIHLEPELYKELVEIATREKRSLSNLVRDMLRIQLMEYKKHDLEKAAKALLMDYQSDQVLTAFTDLDTEDFHIKSRSGSSI